jgi:hypothetical protein
VSAFQRLAFLILAATLVSCGKPLGSYQVTSVTLVPSSTLKKVDPAECGNCDPGSELLRIELRSQTNLYDATDGAGSYVLASFCPYDENRVLYTSEPYYDDRGNYDPRTRKDLPPVKNAKTNDYLYTTYLAVTEAGTPARSGQIEQIAYDLRRQPQDLCLRLFHPGYYITRSQSRVILVPAAMIRRALSAPLTSRP